MNNPYPNAPNAYPQMQQDPAVQRAKDESDLKTLSLLHYAWSALMACSAVGIVVYFVGIAAFVASGHAGPTRHAGDPHAQAIGEGIFVGMGVVMALFMIPLFVLHLMAAAGLKKKTRYMLVMVMSGMACLSVPLGTGLGIWTIMVLNRPSVKALFGRV